MSPEIYTVDIPAEAERLPEVLAFLEQHLEEMGCPFRVQMQITVAAEEIFVNIASYAYAPQKGTASVCLERFRDPEGVAVTFADRGIPFDPLEQADPDVSLSAEERRIGGLGIFMVKKTMDDVKYEYRDGQNILTLIKRF